MFLVIIGTVASQSYLSSFRGLSTRQLLLTRIFRLDGSNQTLTVNQQATDVHIHIQQVKYRGHAYFQFSKTVGHSSYLISTNLIGVSLVNILVLQRDARLINQYYSFTILHDQYQTCQQLKFEVPKTFVYQFFLLSFSYNENFFNSFSIYQARLFQQSSTHFLCLIQSPNFQSFVVNIIGLNINTLLPGLEFMSNTVYRRSNFSLFQYSSAFHIPTMFRLAFTTFSIIFKANLVNYEIQLLDNFNAKEFYDYIIISQYQVRVLYHAEVACPNDKYYYIQTCHTTCPLNTYNYHHFCIKCIADCQICDAQDSCITCRLGYLNLVFSCQQCPENCIECSTDNHCISCKEGYYLDESCKQIVEIQPQFEVTMNQNKQLLIRLLTRVGQPEALLSKIDIVCVGCRMHTISRAITGSQLTVQSVADQAQQRLMITSEALLRPQYEILQKKVQFLAGLPMRYLQTSAHCRQSLNKLDLLSCKVQLLNGKLLSAPVKIQVIIKDQKRTAYIQFDDSSFSFEFRAGLNQCRDCLVKVQLSSDYVLKQFMFTRAVQCRADFVALGDISTKMLNQLNSASNKTFGFFNFMLAVMNLLGLLQPVELIFLSINNIKLTTRFVDQTPIIYRPFPLSVSAIQSLLLPDVITNSLQTNFKQVLSQSTLWLIVYLLPIITSTLFNLLIARLLSCFICAEKLLRPNVNIELMQSPQSGNLFSMGAMSFAWEYSIQKMLVVNFACCWLFFSSLFLKKAKTITQRVKNICLCDFILSFLLGIASRILSELAELACFAILLHLARLFLGFKFKQKIMYQICTGMLIGVNICLLISKFTRLWVTVMLGILLIAFFSAILLVNLISIILITSKTLRTIYRRYKNLDIKNFRPRMNYLKLKQSRAVQHLLYSKIKRLYLTKNQVLTN